MQQPKQPGFTLLEMMVVLGILAILLTISVPSYESRSVRTQVNESLELIKTLKESVGLFYLATQKFPRNNNEAGIPDPEFLVGNFVQRIDLVNGAFQISFGNKASTRLKNKILTVRPMVVQGSPESPISWVCGFSGVPENMIAIGSNNTNVEKTYLPPNCFL